MFTHPEPSVAFGVQDGFHRLRVLGFWVYKSILGSKAWTGPSRASHLNSPRPEGPVLGPS